MAACCALGAFIIYQLISIHSKIPFLRNTASEGESISTPIEPKTKTCRLSLQGLTCSSCVTSVEEACHSLSGISALSVSLHTLTATVVYDPARVTPQQLVAEIEEAGFSATILVDEGNSPWVSQWRATTKSQEETLRSWRFKFNASAIASGVVFLFEASESQAAILLQNSSLVVLVVAIKLSITTIATSWLARDIHKDAWRVVSLCRRPNASILSSSGVILSFTAAVHQELSVLTGRNPSHNSVQFRLASTCLLLTVIIGGRLTKVLVSQSSTGYPSLLASALPHTAQVLKCPEGSGPDSSNLDSRNHLTVPVELVQKGDLIIVDPHTQFPADCEIINGRTMVLETITKGEMTPTAIGPGDHVYAGCSNGLGQVLAKVRYVGNETWLSRALEAMAQAQTSRAKPSSDYFGFGGSLLASGFSTFVLLLAILTGLYHWYWNASTGKVLTRLASVLLCACPCTLDMGMSVCVMAAISVASQNGIFLRPGINFKLIPRIRTIIFDKTGTLTSGLLETQEACLESAWMGDKTRCSTFWQLVGTLAQQSDHPVSRLLFQESQRQLALIQHLFTSEATAPVLLSYEEHPGCGLTGVFSHESLNLEVAIGSTRLMQMKDVHYVPNNEISAPRNTEALLSSGCVYICINNQQAGCISYVDTVVQGAKNVIRSLQDHGFRTFMMTGDFETAAVAIAKSTGIPLSNVHASLLPHQKAGLVQRLQAQYGPAIMVGDHVNDMPALAAATLGILVRHQSVERGSIISQLQGDTDVLLLPLARRSTHKTSNFRNLQQITHTIDLAHATSQRMRFILCCSLFYNLVALCLASGLVRAMVPASIGAWFDLQPSYAGLAMTVSSCCTLLLSLQLIKWRPKDGVREERGVRQGNAKQERLFKNPRI